MRRIQRKRTRGWRMPEKAVYVGRPTRFGNPFVVGKPDPITGEVVRSRAEAVERYRQHVGVHGVDALTSADVALLRGKDLACWCPLDEPCHADVLLDVANR